MVKNDVTTVPELAQGDDLLQGRLIPRIHLYNIQNRRNVTTGQNVGQGERYYAYYNMAVPM
jgi:hypothetical protein